MVNALFSRKLKSLLPALLLLLLLATPAQAQDPPDDDDCLVWDPTGLVCVVPAFPDCEPVADENIPWQILADWSWMRITSVVVNGIFFPITVVIWWLAKIVVIMLYKLSQFHDRHIR